MSCSFSVASKGFERYMCGFWSNWLYDDTGSAQKISDVLFRFRDGPSPLPSQAEHSFVNGDRGRLSTTGSRQRRQ